MLLNVFLFVTFLLDAAMLRTLWLSSFNLAIRYLFTACFIIKFVLVVLEGVEKRAHFIPEYQNLGPEDSSGFYGQSILWWLHGIIVLGGRQVLKPTDLYPISKDMSSEELGNTFWELWTNRLSESANPVKEIEKQRPTLTKVLFYMFRGPLLIPVVPRLSLIGFTFCQALLLKRLLSYLSSPAERKTSSVGIGLVGAYAIVYLGIAVMSSSEMCQSGSNAIHSDILRHILAPSSTLSQHDSRSSHDCRVP